MYANIFKAELQYTSWWWWDGSRMKFEMGGMDPTCTWGWVVVVRKYKNTAFVFAPLGAI